MSTATLDPAPTRPDGPAAPRPGLLHGLTWLTWRRHRAAAWSGLALLLALAVLSVVLHHTAGGYLDAHDLRDCATSDPVRCERGLNVYRGHYGAAVNAYLTLFAALPPLAGAFLGAPLLARDIERGTHRLVWSQSVTRTRWLTVTAALPLAGLLVLAACSAALASWTRGAVDAPALGIPWYEAVPFLATGPAVLGWTAVAFALGTAAGVVLRRTLPALAVALLGLGGFGYGMSLLRPHLAPMDTDLFPRDDGATLDRLDTSWYVHGPSPATAGGHVFPRNMCLEPGGEDYLTCLRTHDATHTWVRSHPPGDALVIHLAETGAALALAAVLIALGAWWLRRRTD